MGISISRIRWRKNKSEYDRVTTGLGRNTPSSIDERYSILMRESFIRIFNLERKRAERSGKQRLLMLVDLENVFQADKNGTGGIFSKVVSALSSSTRETDITGWYKPDLVIGVIFTEIGQADISLIQDEVPARVGAGLQRNLGVGQINAIQICFHFFPEDINGKNCQHNLHSKLCPRLSDHENSKPRGLLFKRMMDILLSLSALVIFSPLLLVIALAIKLSSKGPIVFRQARLGQQGIRFTFLKFRSMCLGNDPSIDREYVRRFISGKRDRGRGDASQDGLNKMRNDPRITPIGKFLRRSSLDELPQLWNVLKREMSLVGPRPPIPYEFDSYDIWHKRRVWDVKPGITGLWQVKGRSKTSFDDMVRLDLRYAKPWSVWLDIRIILQTPRAVFSGEGAY